MRCRSGSIPIVTSSSYALFLICTMWLFSLLLNSGDVHPNPGPANFDVLSNHTSTSSTSYDLYSFINFPNHLSTIHYNVQSIRFKTDLLLTEFSQFDISFTETWLSDNCPVSDLSFPSFHAPERKDRLQIGMGVSWCMLKILFLMSEEIT